LNVIDPEIPPSPDRYIVHVGKIANTIIINHPVHIISKIRTFDGNKRSADTLRTFRQELQECDEKYEVEIIARTKSKNNDIELARTIFPRCKFDAIKCAKGIEALQAYRRQWVEERGTFLEQPYHDWTSNYADAFMNIAVSLPEMRHETKEKEYERATQEFINPDHQIKEEYTIEEWNDYQQAAMQNLMDAGDDDDDY